MAMTWEQIKKTSVELAPSPPQFIGDSLLAWFSAAASTLRIALELTFARGDSKTRT